MNTLSNKLKCTIVEVICFISLFPIEVFRLPIKYKQKFPAEFEMPQSLHQV